MIVKLKIKFLFANEHITEKPTVSVSKANNFLRLK